MKRCLGFMNFDVVVQCTYDKGIYSAKLKVVFYSIFLNFLKIKYHEITKFYIKS